MALPLPCSAPAWAGRLSRSRMVKNSFLLRLLKKVRMQGSGTHLRWVPGAVRGVLSTYVAAPRERDNAAEGPFSAA